VARATHWEPRAPLKAYMRSQAIVDREMRRILLQAANDAAKQIRSLDPNSLRSAQLRLQEQQLRLWSRLGTVIERGIQTTPEMVASLNAAFTDDLLRSLGVRSTDEFKRQMLGQAQSTINNYLGRRNNGLTLSERVYKNGQVASGRIDRLVDSHVLRGSSAREIARDVAGLINPNTPGGISHAAMRLGRTELNNAFHAASVAGYAENPLIDKVNWELSASHPRDDDCDDLYRGSPYRWQDVPDKPHPQCLCFTTPVPLSRSEVVRRFKAGDFNDWADGMIA